MSVIDWSRKPAPWNRLGAEISEYLRKLARGEAVPPLPAYAVGDASRCRSCGRVFKNARGLSVHRHAKHQGKG